MSNEIASIKFYLQNSFSIIGEGLARRAQQAFLTTQTEGLARDDAERSKNIRSIGTFLINHILYMRDNASESVTAPEYGIGYLLTLGAMQDNFAANDRVYIDDRLSQYFEENKGSLFGVVQYYINTVFDVDRLLNPNVTDDARQIRDKTILHRLLSDPKIAGLLFWNELHALEALVDEYSLLDSAEQKSRTQTLRDELIAGGYETDVNKIELQVKTQTELYAILSNYKTFVIPFRNYERKLLTNAYQFDFANNLSKIDSYVNLQRAPEEIQADGEKSQTSGLIGSGPAQWFEDLANATVYKWWPDTRTRGTLPVLFDAVRNRLIVSWTAWQETREINKLVGLFKTQAKGNLQNGMVFENAGAYYRVVTTPNNQVSLIRVLPMHVGMADYQRTVGTYTKKDSPQSIKLPNNYKVLFWWNDAEDTLLMRPENSTQEVVLTDQPVIFTNGLKIWLDANKQIQTDWFTDDIKLDRGQSLRVDFEGRVNLVNQAVTIGKTTSLPKFQINGEYVAEQAIQKPIQVGDHIITTTGNQYVLVSGQDGYYQLDHEDGASERRQTQTFIKTYINRFTEDLENASGIFTICRFISKPVDR